MFSPRSSFIPTILARQLSWARAVEITALLTTVVDTMEPVLQFVALGIWTALCFVLGAVAGWLIRYCTEIKAYSPPKSGKGSKGFKPPQSKKGPVSTDDSDGGRDFTRDARHDDDVSSNLGFDMVSEPADTSVSPPPVPETVVPPPVPEVGAMPRRRATTRGYFDRGPNVALYYTDTDGTRLHTHAQCRGLASRVKPLMTKSTCAWCCDGVQVVP